MTLDRKTHHRCILGVFAFSILLASSGCQGGGSKRVARAEPSFSGTIESDGPVVATPEPAPARTVSYVDRHPLLSKPRDYWESSGDNKVVKAAAATFIGVPVGFVGEMKQIVTGTPAETKY